VVSIAGEVARVLGTEDEQHVGLRILESLLSLHQPLLAEPREIDPLLPVDADQPDVLRRKPRGLNSLFNCHVSGLLVDHSQVRI
jgi:hypothetical protein